MDSNGIEEQFRALKRMLWLNTSLIWINVVLITILLLFIMVDNFYFQVISFLVVGLSGVLYFNRMDNKINELL